MWLAFSLARGHLRRPFCSLVHALTLCGDALHAALSAEVWERAGWCARLTLVLLSERALGTASAFAPYLASIPTRVPVPCVWPPACVASLQGTEIYQVCERLAA